ncbi:CG34398 [Drosophila busckii]|uniref:CG34398 n=1 Tax=Drosophila busckii TaxID=30019 RepID=A0A0M4EBW4_DROBS|nr:CG34398 [Drosophila busckii]
MEVATTNNHNQTHHHHHHHHHVHHNAGNSNNNSVAGGSRSPFQREVREWQRIDPDTGALFSGRLEADRWINGPLNSYGKISDSQNISQPNGTQQTKRKQLEVLRTANGQMQVIRTQTVQKTSSTSRWSSSSTSTTATATATPIAGCWAKLQSQSKPQSLDICELSNDDDDVSDSDSDAGVAIVNDDYVESLPASRQLVDDHVDFVVINGQTDDQDQADDVAHLHKVRHNLLPDTAPSLKLSNLMRRDLESFRHDNNDNDNDDDDDDDLRLSARHQRRQQVSQSVYAPPLPASFSSSLQRARSISTDDLSNDFLQQQQQQPEQDAEPGEWQRVSQLRRSFQSQDYHKASNRARPRPLELPNSSVSVARMRAELENGRRLNTAMRNNQVDLVAIDNILNATAAKPPVAKRSTFLTAESLQEIRGKLKKLSDESLYKDDFLALQTPPSPPAAAAAAATATVAATPSAFRAVHNTHSLETRQARVKESASDWHLRRKSYGFEKMSPPENRSIFRVDASTDSGLGRSGEQLGSWSPSAASNATVIHFGRQQSSEQSAPVDSELSKRHSIAVEETWRDIRKTSQVQVNGSAAATPSQLQRSSAQKRVEFCKTEVHFAAESGRVNIVETDGKPPPTQNFRRRRRTASGPLQSLVKSASVSSSSSSNSSSSSFGTEPNRRQTIATSTVAYRATLMEPPELVTQPAAATQVTVVTATPQPALEPRFSLLESTSRHSYTSTSGVDTTDNETDELAHIRGILKNKPVKPKPYHLGENIESADALWSVPATMKSEREQSPHSRESATGDSPISIKSVAERVRIVEQRQQQQPAAAQQASPAGNGYSTKINVSLGNEEWTETGSSVYCRRRSSAQQLLLQDLRTHQRILDEGLKSTTLIMKTMRSASEFDEAMRRLSIASIESALIQPTIVVPTPMLRSHSYQEQSTRRASSTSTTSITSSDLFGSTLYDSLPRTPLAPPRLKLLGNTQIPVSQQLTQLRRLYDAAEQEEDSADEEVKRYFRESEDSGGGTQCSCSPEEVVALKGSEYSSSWSRLKAKRTIWRIEAQEQTLQRADLPKSNVMNIALHAPKLQKPKPTPPTLRIGQLVPIAKPRTLLVQPLQTQLSTDTADDSGSESLKIVKEARGARKLREHELSYFGVQNGAPSSPQPTRLKATPTNPRRTLPTRSKLSHNEVETAATTTTTTKWQLLNDRPDLLRHSPQSKDDKIDAAAAAETEHCYENIANELTTTFRVKSPSPVSYERKTDLQRDAQILSEMTRNADQTMKALSDEAAFKDQRRRSFSLQRRSNKPLATIDEKVKAYNGDGKPLAVARGTFASEARRNSRQSTPSPTRARSSSQSSIECCPRDRSRSSSRESMPQGGGSSDEQHSKQRVERLRLRTPKREKSRHESTEQRSAVRQSSKARSSSAHVTSTSSSQQQQQHHSRSHSHRDKEPTASSSSSRLVRSARIPSEESRTRSSAHRNSERERERERSRGSEKHRDELTRSRADYASIDESAATIAPTPPPIPLPPPRRKRQRSLIPVPIQTTTTTTPTANAYEYRTQLQMIPPSYSNQSTLRCKPALQPRKSTQSTSSSFAFLPYLAAKRNSSVSHVYDNYLLYAAPSARGASKLRPYQHNLINEHAQLFGATAPAAGGGGGGSGGLGSWPKRLRMRQHQHHSSGSGKHHVGAQPQHHVHSLTTTTIAATKHQRERHGKDRK